MRGLDVALFITFFTLIAFVVFVAICNVNKIEVQDSLINMFLGIVGAEIASCGGIQIFKIKHKNKQEESENAD